jgi:hypothetical protein
MGRKNINFSIPIQKMKNELLMTPIGIQLGPKSDRKSNQIKDEILKASEGRMSGREHAESMRLDKYSEKSTSRTNTHANIPRQKKMPTGGGKAQNSDREVGAKDLSPSLRNCGPGLTGSIYGNFGLKKLDSAHTKDSKKSDYDSKKGKYPIKDLKENFQAWKRIKKINSMKTNDQLSVTKQSSKEFSTKNSINKDGALDQAKISKRVGGLKLKDSYLCGINPQNLKQLDLMNLKQCILKEIRSTKGGVSGGGTMKESKSKKPKYSPREKN